MISEADIHLECGGKGTCGKCLVELVWGTVERKGQVVSVKQGEMPARLLSCQCNACGDAVFSIVPDRAREAAQMSLGKDIAEIPKELLPVPADISPMVKTLLVHVDPPTAEQNYPDARRLEKQIRTALATDAPVFCTLPALAALPAALAADGGRIWAQAFERDGAVSVVSVQAPQGAGPCAGLACDIGTTTVSLHCVDLKSGAVLATKSDYNAQIRRGADVISRIEYARSGARMDEMRGLVLRTINGLIDAALSECGIAQDAIFNVTLAGNTTMIHLLLGLPSQAIRESPYVPVVNAPPVLAGRDVGLHVHPFAAVWIAPGVGSYVGGDITSGLLTTPLIKKKNSISLFMDIGTNGEIAIGNAEFLITAACSAGPAFEGAGIKCGMRAATGAIESFETDRAMEQVRFGVMGGGKPKGICGSGLISVLGELYTKGIVDRAGRISGSAPAGRVTTVDGTPGLILVPCGDANDGNAIVITEADIDNLVRTKAAIYAACDLMLANIGLTTEDLSHVYIAGGFGRFIDVEQAVRIGMLPDIARNTFTYLGNSSLTGATLSLLSKKTRTHAADLAARMTYVDLSSDNRYMDAYVAALFLPHTDSARFPSIR